MSRHDPEWQRYASLLSRQCIHLTAEQIRRLTLLASQMLAQEKK